MKGRVKIAVAGRALSLLVDLAFVVAFAVVLAYWTVQLASPPALAALAGASEGVVAEGASVAGRHLLGSSDELAGAGTSRFKLLGVIAPDRAIVVADGDRPRSFARGEAMATGVVLKEVHPDYVVLTNNGATERLVLERRTARVETSRGARVDAPR